MRCRAATSCFVISRCIPKMTKNGLKTALYTRRRSVNPEYPGCTRKTENAMLRSDIVFSLFQKWKCENPKISKNRSYLQWRNLDIFAKNGKKWKKAKNNKRNQHLPEEVPKNTKKHQKWQKMTKFGTPPKITKITKSKSAHAHFSVFTFQNRIPKSTPRGPPPAKPYGGSGWCTP